MPFHRLAIIFSLWLLLYSMRSSYWGNYFYKQLKLAVCVFQCFVTWNLKFAGCMSSLSLERKPEVDCIFFCSQVPLNFKCHLVWFAKKLSLYFSFSLSTFYMFWIKIILLLWPIKPKASIHFVQHVWNSYGVNVINNKSNNNNNNNNNMLC